jgi:UDP-N-acetylmuramate dehydrogenase
MIFSENQSLKAHHTFGIDVKSKYYAEFRDTNQLNQCLDFVKKNSLNMLVMGGGSNILFTKDFEGAILKNQLLGIEKIEETNDTVVVKSSAGEVWHDLVLYCVEKNWGGLENLSLIPGCVGAAPIQNIGAYGVEIKDTFLKLEALNIASRTVETFNSEQCRFGYRDSIFKNQQKNKYIILAVYFQLEKNPILHTSYGAIQDTLSGMGIQKPSIQDVSHAVCHIRQSKLPNPKEIGNAGSFFKNPEIKKEHYQKLCSQYPEIPSYPIDDDMVKIPAGWLIEKAGWKGKTINNFGVHKHQALVLVNYGNALGSDIEQLSKDIKKSILEKFEIELETEVNIV